MPVIILTGLEERAGHLFLDHFVRLCVWLCIRLLIVRIEISQAGIHVYCHLFYVK